MRKILAAVVPDFLNQTNDECGIFKESVFNIIFSLWHIPSLIRCSMFDVQFPGTSDH